jgi:ATP-NAD kinase C-terminal domain
MHIMHRPVSYSGLHCRLLHVEQGCSWLPCVAAAGTLITPIAPHSLSFRPLVVPESSEIVVQIPKHARSHARCPSFSSPA